VARLTTVFAQAPTWARLPRAPGQPSEIRRRVAVPPVPYNAILPAHRPSGSVADKAIRPQGLQTENGEGLLIRKDLVRRGPNSKL